MDMILSFLLAGLLCMALVPASSARTRRARSEGRSPELSRRLVREGVEQIRAKQFSTAIAGLDRAVRSDGTSAEAFFQLGNAYYQRSYERGTPERPDKDDAQSAIDAYRTALALDPEGRALPDKYLIHHGMAQCYETLGRGEDALASLKEAALARPKSPMPNLYAASLRLRMGDPAMAAANFETSVKRAYRAKTVPKLAALVKTDAQFADLLSLPANQAVLRAYEGAAAGSWSEDQAALRSKAARDAVASTPGFSAREPMRDALRDSVRGEAEGRRGSPVAARLADPEVFQILDKANNAFAAQRLQDAVGYYQAALEADGRRGELDEVQKSLIFERMGTAYRQMGLAGEASRALRRAVAQAPQNSAAHYQLSLCMAMDGRIADSLGELNKALDSASTIEDLRKIMLMAKTDPELEGVRDMPKFAELIRSHSSKLSARR